MFKLVGEVSPTGVFCVSRSNELDCTCSPGVAMFDSLSDRLSTVFDKLRGRGALSEDDVRAAVDAGPLGSPSGREHQ